MHISAIRWLHNIGNWQSTNYRYCYCHVRKLMSQSLLRTTTHSCTVTRNCGQLLHLVKYLVQIRCKVLLNDEVTLTRPERSCSSSSSSSAIRACSSSKQQSIFVKDAVIKVQNNRLQCRWKLQVKQTDIRWQLSFGPLTKITILQWRH